MTTITATKEVTITRVFDAPRSRVFKMWVEPKQKRDAMETNLQK